MIALSFLTMVNIQHLPQLVTQITIDTYDTAKWVWYITGPAFQQLYLYPCYTLQISMKSLKS